ncbi:MAG TPA: hypothetical protein PKC28_01955 [Bdellovibrionales bacterium]|nr:hypothetical protein [Bdellovibrionales bacterium]
MRALIFALTFGLGVASLASVGAEAATKKTAKAKKPAYENKTNHDFDDQSVHGEYQMPDEALAKVENEKGLSDLLGVRKHFKDRLAEAADQE